MGQRTTFHIPCPVTHTGSPDLNDSALMPSDGFTEKKKLLIGPRRRREGSALRSTEAANLAKIGRDWC